MWLREGVIRPILDNSTTAFPQIPETLFAVLLAVGGSRAPDFSSWLTLGLLLLISAGLAMRMGLSATQAWWVAAIVATMPAVYAGIRRLVMRRFARLSIFHLERSNNSTTIFTGEALDWAMTGSTF